MEKSVQRLVLIKLLLSLCGNNGIVNANPLIGDKVMPAEEGQFPFVVSLGVAPATCVSNHYCTGTLIAKRYVLTAAHCTEVNDKTRHFMHPSKVVVTVGSNDLTKGTKYKVKTWKTFEQWAAEKKVAMNDSTPLFHDIAVVTLADDVKDIKPAHVSNLNMKDIYGKTVVAVGWGKTNFRVWPRFLQTAKLQVLNRKECLRNLKARDMEPRDVLNHLCTAANPQISLGNGDSGGPILINGDEVVGVNECDCANHGDPHQQNLHTSVKFYRKFIMDVIGI